VAVDLRAWAWVFTGVMGLGVAAAGAQAQSGVDNMPPGAHAIPPAPAPVVHAIQPGPAPTVNQIPSGPAETGKPISETMHGVKVTYLKPMPVPSPFPLEGTAGRVSHLEFRAPEAMTAEDRAAADGAQAEIARRAELAGLHMNEMTGWGYEQAVCPVFPEHVILEYSRKDAPGDVTLFSAVVPRGGVGHVRVIPVRRRGYSLWTPADSNALTLNDFNHIETESGLSAATTDWLTLSLCYTALAAGHVRAGLVPANQETEVYPLVEPPLLTSNSNKPEVEVRLVDAAAPRPRGEWVFDYDAVGHLKRVRKIEPEILHTQPVQGIQKPADFHGTPTSAP